MSCDKSNDNSTTLEVTCFALLYIKSTIYAKCLLNHLTEEVLVIRSKIVQAMGVKYSMYCSPFDKRSYWAQLFFRLY